MVRRGETAGERMELNDLKLFCDLVETGSFSRSAERNFVSQSAVSQRLRAIELEFKQSFLDRGKGKGRVTPTEAGRVLYEGAKPLLSAYAELDANLRGLSDEIGGTVRVATVYSVGLHALPKRLKPFLADHPRVNVHLEYSQTPKIYQDVLSGAVDVGIVACPTAKTGVEILPFDTEPMVLICAPTHPLARTTSVRLDNLDEQPFIAFADDIPTRKLVDERLRAAGVKVRVVAEYDNIETIKNLVEIGSGIALVPEPTVVSEAREGTLTIVPLAASDAFLRPSGLLVKKAGTRRGSVRAFVEAMLLREDI